MDSDFAIRPQNEGYLDNFEHLPNPKNPAHDQTDPMQLKENQETLEKES